MRGRSRQDSARWRAGWENTQTSVGTNMLQHHHKHAITNQSTPMWHVTGRQHNVLCKIHMYVNVRDITVERPGSNDTYNWQETVLIVSGIRPLLVVTVVQLLMSVT